MAGRTKRTSLYADLDLLRTSFEAQDSEKSGYIGYSELTKLACEMQGFEESMVPELMERLDRDKDGKVSFEDFQALFELEREEVKQSFTSPSPVRQTPPNLSQSLLEYNTAYESFPSETLVSPSPTGASAGITRMANGGVPESPTVVLRHKRFGRSSAPSATSRSGVDFLSPIHREEPTSTDMTDLGLQKSGSSPQLKRNSRVLSWITESEDMLFEDTGTGTGESPGVFFPPTSPLRSGDEAYHVKTILQSVCHTHEIGKEAISKLCNHVKADPQEEQELLSLLDDLDHCKQGWVSLDEFVKGLQDVRNAAVVAFTSSTPPKPLPRRGHSDQPIPRLSEPFDTPFSSKPSGVPLASTPLPTAGRVDGHAVLSVLDPDNSGYVKPDSLIFEWQKMGVEAPHNESLQDALAEVVPMDAAGRMSVSDLTASLEGAILAEGKTPTVLRQAALKSFKYEISTLRSQVHQVSLERDKLRTSISRAQDEKKRLVREGEDHVDHVTGQLETKIKKLEVKYTERMKEIERSRQEEAQMLQDRAAKQIAKLEETLDTLKAEEERLRDDLKYAQEEVTDISNRLTQAHRELAKKDRTIDSLQRDLSIHSEFGYGGDINMQLSRISELENELSERASQNQELLERTRELSDRVDVLSAENEDWRQKYISQKRRMQRRRSSGSMKHSDHQKQHRRRRRHSSDESSKSGGRPHSAGSRRTQQAVVTSPPRPFSAGVRRPMGSIAPMSSDLEEEPSDSEDQDVFDLDSPSSPLPLGLAEVQEVQVQYQEGGDSEGSISELSTNSSDDFFSKSTASLMEEIQQEDNKNRLGAIERLKRQKSQLEKSCQNLMFRLREADKEVDRDELQRELERKRLRQAQLEKHVQSLEKQRKRLSVTRRVIDAQLANAEESIAKQLEDIHGLKTLIAGSELDSSVDSQQLHVQDLQEELEITDVQYRSSNEESIPTPREDIVEGRTARVSVSYSQQLEEECSQLSAEIQTLQGQLETEKAIYAKELEAMKEQLHRAQALLEEREEANEIEATGNKEMFEQVQVQLAEYQQRAESLEKQLLQAESELTTKKEELLSSQKELVALQTAVLREGPTVEDMSSMMANLEQLQEQYAQSSEKNEHLRKQAEHLQVKMVASEKRAEEEISKLRTQLINVHKEITDQSTLYEDEISQIKEDARKESKVHKQRAELRLAEVRAESEKHIQSLKQRYELQLEVLKQDLKSKELREKGLEGKLALVEMQCENALNEVAEFMKKEANWESQMVQYEANEESYKNEISQSRMDATKLQAELMLLKKDNQVTFSSPTRGLQSRNKQTTLVHEEVANEETDWPETTPASASPRPSSRSSYQSEQSAHDELIIQMKSQLEELQKVLMVQSRLGDEKVDGELSLVQELLTNNCAIQAELQRVVKGFETERLRHKELYASKEDELKRMKSKIGEERRALECLVTVTAKELLGKVHTLNNHSRESIAGYQSKIQDAISLLATVKETLHDRDQRHTKAMDSLLSDLDSSRSFNDTTADESDLLRSGLDKPSHKTTNCEHTDSQDTAEVERLKIELKELQEKLSTKEEVEVPEAHETASVNFAALVAPKKNAEIDARKHEIEIKDQQLQIKEKEVQNLRHELEKSRVSERTMQRAHDNMASEVEKLNLQLKEAESLQQVMLSKLNEIEAREMSENEKIRMHESATQVQAKEHFASTQAKPERPEVQDSSTQAEPEVQESSTQAEPEVQETSTQAKPEVQETSTQAEPEVQETSTQAEPEVQETSTQAAPKLQETSMKAKPVATMQAEPEIHVATVQAEPTADVPSQHKKQAQADTEDWIFEIHQRDKVIQQREEEVEVLKDELEKATFSAEQAKKNREMEIQEKEQQIQQMEREIQVLRDELEVASATIVRLQQSNENRVKEIQEKVCEIQQMGNKLSSKDQRIHELERNLSSVVSEPIEAVVQYIEMQPLESVNEAALMQIQKELQTGNSRLLEIESEHQEEVQQLKDVLNRSMSDSLQHEEQLAAMSETLQEAEEKLRVSVEAQESLRDEYEQHMQDMKQKHANELSMAQSVVEEHNKELKELYALLVTPKDEEELEEQQLDHSVLAYGMREEIEKLKAQVSHERSRSEEMEMVLAKRMEEHDEMEAQLLVEHEEEVRALHQQKQQLLFQMDDLRNHCQQILDEHNKQNVVQLRNVFQGKAQLESQLQEKAEESFQAYQQIALLLEEKKVVMDIIQQLSVEAGKQIDIL